MAGTVQCETVLYAKEFHPYTISQEEREELVRGVFGDKTDEMVELFKKAYPDGDLLDLYSLDIVIRKGAYEYLDRKAKTDAPIYCYLIKYHLNYFGGMPSYHGICLPLVFGNTEYVDALNEPDAVALSQKMHQAWINFATYGNPNGGDVPEWDQYREGERGVMVFDKKCEMRYDFDHELIWKYVENSNFADPFFRVKKKD